MIRTIATILLLVMSVGYLWFTYQVVRHKKIIDKPDSSLVHLSPAWFDTAPLLSRDIAHAVYPYIYLSDKDYAEYQSGELSVWLQSVLVHEKFHLGREEKFQPMIFGIMYALSKDFRLREELLAIRAQMEFLKSNGETYPIDWKASQFADDTYGKILTQEEAVKILTRLWEQGVIED